MKLPRYTAETPPPRESGLARAQDIGALTRTGDAAVWRGVSQVGGAMQRVAGLGFDAYQRRRMFDDEIQFGRATQKNQEIVAKKLYEIERTDFKMDMPLPDDPDYEKTLAEFTLQKRDEGIKGAMKDIDELVGKIPQGFSSRRAAERYKLHWANTRASAERKIIHAYDRKLDDFQRNAMDDLWQDAAQNGDIETANYYIELMDKGELITPAQASVRKGRIEEMASRTLMNEIYETAKEMPYTDAIEFINDMPGLERADRNDLIARRKRQNEIETATTNRKVRWDTLRKVTDNPDSITDEYLESLVKPNSLTWDDAEEFKKIRDTENHPLKTSRYKLYSGILDAVYVDVTKPKGEVDLDRILEYDQKNTELQNYFETNPDAQSPEKAKKFFDDLNAEAKRDWINNILNPFGYKAGTVASRLYEWRKGRKIESETFKHAAINPNTGERMGSNDGVKWQPIP